MVEKESEAGMTTIEKGLQSIKKYIESRREKFNKLTKDQLLSRVDEAAKTLNTKSLTEDLALVKWIVEALSELEQAARGLRKKRVRPLDIWYKLEAYSSPEQLKLLWVRGASLLSSRIDARR